VKSSSRPESHWLRPALWSVLLAALLGVAAAAVYQQVRRGERQEALSRAAALPSLGEVPDERLTNHDGRTVALRSLLGAPWIADFVFTRCQSSCPLLSARMARLDRALPAALHLVSISVDPANDTPQVLARYARSFAASPRWLFLTGDAARIGDLSRRGFKLAVQTGGASLAAPMGAILHSTRFVLIDARGTIRGFYDALDPAALRRLTADAAALAEER
jgi:protein SCO1/2